KSLMMRRAAAQPIHQRNCGSVFSNPPGDHAARLIEASGLKGLSVGEARVSEKHANFIVNLGKATATDIETLIEKIQATVESAHAVRLAPEVKIVGEPTRSASSEGE
ncbi:MAG: UDP-N-acetylmuramate dehydrogenase, partial [Gammaproteobacteria bacterium]